MSSLTFFLLLFTLYTRLGDAKLTAPRMTLRGTLLADRKHPSVERLLALSITPENGHTALPLETTALGQRVVHLPESMYSNSSSEYIDATHLVELIRLMETHSLGTKADEIIRYIDERQQPLEHFSIGYNPRQRTVYRLLEEGGSFIVQFEWAKELLASLGLRRLVHLQRSLEEAMHAPCKSRLS